MLAQGLLKRWRRIASDTPCAEQGDLIAQLLANRGITDPAAVERFLKPSLNDLADPAELPGADRAARRLAQAVAEGQPIIIYGDYDVDGVTASAVLWRTLRAAGAEPAIYIPHRVEEGYGLNAEAIASLAAVTDLTDAETFAVPAPPAASAHQQSEISNQKSSPPLVVTVDCGITAVEPARLARELGVDLIITDHHHFDADNLPPAHTLVHPELGGGGREEVGSAEGGRGQTAVGSAEGEGGIKSSSADCPLPTAPSPSPPAPSPLCGAGVAFKLAWQFARVHGGRDKLAPALRELMVDMLSLVALGTVADVVPLTGENRILTTHGLLRIKHTPLTGLAALIDAANLSEEHISAYHVGFVLGPRLNACGRMGHAREAARLLTIADEPEARELARLLTAANDQRRATERRIFDEARQLIEDSNQHDPEHRALVVGKEDWHVGVVGIVASRLVERFHRPAVVLAMDNGSAKGSARSVAGLSIHEAFAACSEHLTTFGGHAMAAGLSLPAERVTGFRDALVRFVNERLAADDLVAVLDIDAEVELEACTVELFNAIGRLAPFGRGNPRPLLLTRGVTLDQPPQFMGREGKHLALFLRRGRCVMRCPAFNIGALAEHLHAGDTVDVVFEPNVSQWRGQWRAELHVRDVRVV